MNNEISYTRVGDYLLPNIRLREASGLLALGKYGLMHKRYLKRYRPMLYSQLLLTERLYPLCREVDEVADNRILMIGTAEQAHEIILSELVYI